ncbi:MAG: hypothetical protein EXX96DRAFT_233133 [Benjaminiella poitrasii]|nr:MAG: hypothetical protein EXX96DRAFT_233133 [Benjaminiella poitrasii]
MYKIMGNSVIVIHKWWLLFLMTILAGLCCKTGVLDIKVLVTVARSSFLSTDLKVCCSSLPTTDLILASFTTLLRSTI